MKKYIGIDIGGTAVKSALVGEDGKILRRSSIPTVATRPYKEIAADIAEQIKALSGGETVEGVGIGCPGAIDSAHGLIKYSNNLYWKDVPLGEELKRLTGWSVHISNDANVAALGETRFGVGKAYTDTALITLGTGVGGGLVVELLGGGRVQKEVAVKEGFHNRTSNPMFDLKSLYWKPEDLSTQIEEAAPGRLWPCASLPFAASPIGNFLTARQISCIINLYQPWSFIPVL